MKLDIDLHCFVVLDRDGTPVSRFTNAKCAARTAIDLMERLRAAKIYQHRVGVAYPGGEVLQGRDVNRLLA